MRIGHLSLSAVMLAAGASTASASVLWDQITGATVGTNSVLSQVFEPANVNFNSSSIDNFTLGSASTIQSVDFSMLYFNGPGPALSWNIEIYSSPAAALAAGTSL